MHYVMSDIHGAYERFVKMLKKINFSDKDVLYIIGDIPSRGDQTFQLLDYVMDSSNMVHIKGNHELFLQLYLEDDPRMQVLYARFGGAKVIRDICKMSQERKEKYRDYLQTLPLYEKILVDDREYILTHSGYMVDVPPILKEDGSVDIEASITKWGEHFEYEYLISNDLHYIPAGTKHPFMIVGHYPTVNLECDGIYIGNRYIDMDNGVNITRGRKLACLRLEDMKEYYV